jgi:hypothetical protein
MREPTMPADHPPCPALSEFAVADDTDFLRALAPGASVTAAVQQALAADDLPAAKLAFIVDFRRRTIDSPLLTQWEQIPRDPAFRDATADDCLAGRLHDGYNVYDIPESGVDWYECPLFCLPRFPVFPALLAAWHHSQDERYIRFIVDHSLEYIAAYPIATFANKHSNEGNRGHYVVGPPTWWCLCPNRLDQWAHAVSVLRRCDCVTDAELFAILRRMFEETRYLLTQVDFWVDRQHNVAGFDVRVIAELCAIFADFAEAADWRRRDCDWLRRYVTDAFYPDGLYKELTLGYSSSVVLQLCRSVDALAAAAELRGQLMPMVEAFVGMARPDGFVPSFGDASGRHLSNILHQPVTDALGSAWLAALGRPLAGAIRSTADCHARLAPIDDAWAERVLAAPPPFTSWPAADAEIWGGYYAMRSSWEPTANYLMIDGGPWGTTHQHMDRLSFVLSAGGVNFITDPCNTLYANNEPDARLSTLHAGFVHNTVTVDGVDEFAMDMAAECATDTPLSNRWERGAHHVLFAGHFDFAPLRPVVWQRRVLFVDGAYWLIQDVLTGEPASVDVEINFQFEEEIDVTVGGDQALATAAAGPCLGVVFAGSPLSARVVVGDETPQPTCSTQYGSYTEPRMFGQGRGWIARVGKSILPAPALVFTGRVQLPFTHTIVLTPQHDADATGGEVRCATAADGCQSWHLPHAAGALSAVTSPDVFTVLNTG